MSTYGPKVEFALGSQESPGHYFKSSFARSFVTNCRDAKSLDLEFLDNGTITEESESNHFSDTRNNNFCSLMNFDGSNELGTSSGPQSSSWQTFNAAITNSVDIAEMEKLRKQCQALTEENRRLAESLQAIQVPRVPVIDNVFLQKIDTLEWQLKQTEANRQMYRSLMGQVVCFLERARKSLDILHEKSNPKGKIARVPRSRSVHGIDEDISMKREQEEKQHQQQQKQQQKQSNVSSPNRTNVSSRFTRAKSVAQISPQITTGFRAFTWSVLRKNDPGHCTPPRNKRQQTTTSVSTMGLDNLNKTHEGVYTRPKYPAEIDPDNVPPEKLSQEAFRLMRTVQSLLAMREPDLAMVSSNDEEVLSSSPLDDEVTPSRKNRFANSTVLHDAISYNGGCSSSDRGSNESESERTSFAKSAVSTPSIMESSMSSNSTLQSLIPRARRSLDATSLNSNSGSSKTEATEEDEEEDEDRRTNTSAVSNKSLATVTRELFTTTRETTCPTSTPNRRVNKKIEKKYESRGWLRTKTRPKPANSVSSAEDESGFSSMSSFQEVGLPMGFSGPISPIKGCHTEIGLPEVPLDKIHHRRWSSTPVEIQAMFKRHSTHFTGSTSNSESLSVWV